MNWHTSTRRKRLPSNWNTIRNQALARANYKCQAKTHAPNCDGKATDIDHITPGDNHQPTNLQALSHPCHQAKTNQETTKRNKQRKQQRTKPQEKHPGQK